MTVTPQLATIIAALIAIVVPIGNFWFLRASQIRAEEAATERETLRWARQTLHEVALDYLRSAFFISGAAGNARRARAAGRSLAEVSPLLTEIELAHHVLTDRLTSLRLLGSPTLITEAQELHDSHHELINIAFSENEPANEEAWLTAKDSARRHRETFINESRAPLGLQASPITIGASRHSSWVVPADVPHPKIETKWSREPG